MLAHKKILTFILLLMLSLPGQITIAQTIENEIVQTEEAATKEKKSEKKKDKDIIEIDKVFFYSLGIDLAIVIIIICFIYFPNYHKLDNVFTFIIFNLVIFLITFVLNKVKISMGAAFGLFAVFSMLRYRTDGISMKELTYLFIFIALGLISAIRLEYRELAVLGGVIVVATFVLDSNYIIRREFSKRIQYERIEMIKPDRNKELIEDLNNRTGLNIHRVTIERIDFLRDTATIWVYYYS